MALNYLLCYSIHHILVCMICSVDTSIISNVLTQCEPTINLYRKVIQLQENLDKWVAYYVTVSKPAHHASNRRNNNCDKPVYMY